MDPKQSTFPVDDDDEPIIRGRGRGSGAGRAARSARGAAAMMKNIEEERRRAQEGQELMSSAASSISTASTIGAGGTSSSSSGITSLAASVSTLSIQPPSSSASTTGGARSVAASGTSISTQGGSTKSGYSRNTGGSVVTRPENWDKKGKDGKIIELLTNYFEVSKQTYQPLYQYRVDFVPEEDSTQLKKNLMKNIKSLGKFIFDGQVMYKTTEIMEENSKHEVMGENNVNYKISIRLVGLVQAVDPVYLQFYNILLRKCMSLLNLEELGRNYYNRFKKITIPEGKMELWPGFATAIRHHECGLFLCVEITHKVLRTSTVMDEINDLLNKLHSNPRKNEIIKEELVGQIVMSKYNRKTYRIDDIDFEASPESDLGGDEEAGSYQDYFLKKYNENITDLNQPMLVSNPRKRDINKGITNKIYLVPSLCNMTGLSDEMRKNFQIMKRVSEHLHVNPSERKKKLDEFMEDLRTNVDVQKEFHSWNIDFSPTFVKVNARYLGMEKIVLNNGVEVLPDYLGDWTSGLRGQKLASSKNIKNWVLFAPENERPGISKFIEGVRRQAQALGMVLEQPTDICYYEARRAADERQLNHTMEKEQNQGCQMVFFVLPNNQLQRYAAVKRFFILEWKVPLQCFLAKNITHKSFNSICSKLMIQVNAKLGGEPWHIKVPLKNMMVLGFDVYHCAQRKNQSVGALVATIAPNLARYYSTVSFHKDKSELSDNMCLDTKKCLEAYRKANNGELPNRIVMYRDGVGEGQINFVLEHEIAHIRAAIEDMYRDREPAMFTFIIVTKKINTRVLVSDAGTKTFTNPAPGTIVDDVITLPERYDFFLVSQSVRQGTVSPTNYNIIWDTSAMAPDRMQRLTYKMCHLYFNWSGTVAVPAPCQYAHKLAYLTGVALNDEAPIELADVLWFL